MCLCVDIFFFFYTYGIILYAQCIAFFSLGNISMTIPYQYIPPNGSISWKSHTFPVSPSSKPWVRTPILPQTCPWLWPQLLLLHMALWGISNTQQVPGPMGFVKMKLPSPYSVLLKVWLRVPKNNAEESGRLLLLAVWPQASSLTPLSLSFLSCTEDSNSRTEWSMWSTEHKAQLRASRCHIFPEEKVGPALSLWPPAFG